MIAQSLPRPALRWFGGKWRLAPWIISHLPEHRVYVEPFGGAASVLLRKPRSYAEVYNDLDGEVVTFFRVLRDPAKAAELVAALELTPFARQELAAADEPAEASVEIARRLVVRCFMNYGADGAGGKGSRAFRPNSKEYAVPARDWRGYPDALVKIIDRWRGVIVECRDAIEVMRQHDAPNVLHYVDPPYLAELRTRNPASHGYNHELPGHVPLLAALRDLAGMVALSGYESALYDAALPGWEKRTVAALADGALPRVECLWLNKACVAALGHGPLFGGDAK